VGPDDADEALDAGVPPNADEAGVPLGLDDIDDAGNEDGTVGADDINGTDGAAVRLDKNDGSPRDLFAIAASYDAFFASITCCGKGLVK
jgi:hypothetical protein